MLLTVGPGLGAWRGRRSQAAVMVCGGGPCADLRLRLGGAPLLLLPPPALCSLLLLLLPHCIGTPSVMLRLRLMVPKQLRPPRALLLFAHFSIRHLGELGESSRVVLLSCAAVLVRRCWASSLTSDPQELVGGYLLRRTSYRRLCDRVSCICRFVEPVL